MPALRIGLFYGSTNGTTARVAEKIKRLCECNGWATVELLDVAEYYLDEMASFDYLLLGAPTWNHGQLQRDWETVFAEFDELDLKGKQAALFGVGDQVGYPDTFVDSMAFLADKLAERGAHIVGAWPTDGYRFAQSWAAHDGHFVGLALDEENQPELTDVRLQHWLEQLRREWGLEVRS